MSEFSVRTDRITRFADVLEAQAKILENAADSADAVGRNLRMQGLSDLSVKSAIGSIGNAAGKEASAARRMGAALREIAEAYRAAENTILGATSGITGVGGSLGGSSRSGSADGGSTGGLAFTNGNGTVSALYSSDPVNLNTGNFILDNQDMEIPGFFPLRLGRFYNSMGTFDGMLGAGWNSSFERRLSKNPAYSLGRADASVVLEDGREEYFLASGDGRYRPVSGTTSSLTHTEKGYVYRTLDGESSWFDEDGRFVRFEDLHKTGFSLIYKENALARVEKDSGEFFDFFYKDGNRLDSVRDHTGRACRYAFEGDYLKRVVLPDGNTYEYTYNPYGKISRVQNPRRIGAVETEYDEWQRVVFQRFADGTTNTFEYRDEEQAVIMTERNGVRSTHIHDEKYQNIRNIYPDGEEHFEYNERGQKTVLCDRLGNVTRIQYDDRGNIATILTADRTKICVTYNDQNRLLTMSVNGKNRIRNVYNALGDLLIRENAAGEKMEYSYDDQGHMTQILLPDGTPVDAAYDDRGNLRTLRDANGAVIQFEYDALNRQIGRTDANGNRSAFEYDVMGRMTSEIRPDGHKKQYQYDPMGNLVLEENFDGSTTTTVYNENNRPLSVTDPAGRQTLFTYDSMWNLADVTLPNGGVFRYRYDDSGRLESVCDAEGNETRYSYDAAGNVLTRTDAMGMRTDFSWDAMGCCTKVTGADGATAGYQYNEDGQIVYEKGMDGTEYFRTYDAAGRLASEKDSLGHTNAYLYNALGQVICVTDENGRCTRYQYVKGSDHPERIQYPDGTEESFAYDANGNLICFTDIYGVSLRYRYDCLNRLTALEAEQGETMEFGYDLLGRMISRKDFEGNVTRYEYTPTGQLQSVTDALGHVTRYSYDEMDYLTEVLRAAPETGHEVLRAAPETGQGTLQGELPTGLETLRGVPANGLTAERKVSGTELRTLQETPGAELGAMCQIPETESGKLREKWENGIVRITYERDRMGRLTKLTDAARETEEYRYNGLGQMTEKTDRAGMLTRYAYNRSGLLQMIQWADGEKAEYWYDPSGRLCEVDDWTGRTGIQYDRMGNVTEIRYPDGRILRMDYDPRGNRTAVHYPEGQNVEYAYDKLDRLTKMTHDGYAASYSYDEFGRILSRQLSDGIDIRYQYDAKGMLARMTGTDDRGVLEDISYGYDSLRRRVRSDIFRRDDTMENSMESGSFRYLYDPAGHLSQVSRDGRLLREYEYDALGNRSSILRFHPERGIYERIWYEYDPRGGLLRSVRSGLPEEDGAFSDYKSAHTELTEGQYGVFRGAGDRCMGMDERFAGKQVQEVTLTEEYRYDTRGNLIELLRNGNTEKKYEYDARNQLAYAKAENGDTAAYAYNGLGYRIGMRQNLAGVEREIDYTVDYSKIYDNLLERRTIEGAEIFFWGNSLEGFAADHGVYGWYLSDVQGNVLRKMSGQDTLYRNKYDEFGCLLSGIACKEAMPERLLSGTAAMAAAAVAGTERLVENTPGIEPGLNPSDNQVHGGRQATEEFGFSGFRYDPVAGTWFAQARQYRGDTGMFDAMDRFGGDIIMPDSLNPYSYCTHDPLNHTDKSGYWFIVDDIIAAAVGGAGGFAGVLIGDVMESVTAGQFTHSGWKSYLSATTGGAAGGVTTLYAGPMAGGAVSGAVSTLTGEGLTYLSDPGSYTKSLGDVAKETVLNVGLGTLTGAVSGAIGKATRKLANTTVVQGVVSRLQSGGTLAGLAANYITGIASPTTKAWSDMTSVLKNYHSEISSSASLLASMETFMVDNVPLYLKEEVLSRVTGRLKPTNILTSLGKNKLSSWLKSRLGLSNASDADILCAAAS
ncbi:MAG: DUF6531 domain-containing protein [Lachnospiraceae bacterium]|nr:DUF6531 domain-containing protein [Lachnospiraceae bacterium]